MAIAYAISTPANLATSWASSSGGAPSSFGGLPDDTTDVVIDVNSVDIVFNIESLIKSVTVSANKNITQTTPIHVGSFNQSDGDWDTVGQDFVDDGLFSQSGGAFDASLNAVFLVGGLNLTGGSLLGEPSLPTTDTSADVVPTTVAEAITESALNPKRVRGDEGEIEQHPIKDLIEADKYLQSKAMGKTGKVQNLFSIIKPSGTV